MMFISLFLGATLQASEPEGPVLVLTHYQSETFQRRVADDVLEVLRPHQVSVGVMTEDCAGTQGVQLPCNDEPISLYDIWVESKRVAMVQLDALIPGSVDTAMVNLSKTGRPMSDDVKAQARTIGQVTCNALRVAVVGIFDQIYQYGYTG